MDQKKKNFIIKLIQNKFPINILEEKLIKDKYSKEIINELLYKNSQKKILNLNHNIYIIDDFLSNEECDYMIEIGKENLKRAKVSNEKNGIISEGRTGSNNWISKNKSEKSQQIADRFSKLVNIPLINAENFQIIHYYQTQEYKMHYDGWEHNKSDKTLRNIKYGGQRIYTCLCYLNDVEEGGGTSFGKLKINVKAKKGRVLVFKNVFNNTNIRHPLSLHAGMPVIKGEKYAFNLWFREANRKKLYKEINPDYYK